MPRLVFLANCVPRSCTGNIIFIKSCLNCLFSEFFHTTGIGILLDMLFHVFRFSKASFNAEAYPFITF